MKPMRVFAMLLLAALPARALAGAAAAGMGGASVGLPDRTGDIADNPATAATGGVDRGEGLVHLGAGLSRMAFSGRVFNKDLTTVSTLTVPEGLDWMMVTPLLGPGRVAAGAWETDRFALAVDEPLNLNIARDPGGPPLSSVYQSGTAQLRQDQATNAIGASWVQPSAEGDQQFSVGVAYLNTTARDSLEVYAVNAYDLGVEPLRRSAVRSSVSGAALQAGYFFRPVPDGALGLSVLYAGQQRGRAWYQDDGASLQKFDATRPAQLFAGVGGSFRLLPTLVGAVDLKYRGGTTQNGLVESEAVFGIRAGMEYTAQLASGDLPLRAGFFTKPDPLPARIAAPDVSSVAEMTPAPPFRQDILGFTTGTGWARGGLRADLGLVWMLATTHVKTRRADGSLVDSGDVRSAFGAIASLSLLFSPHPAPTSALE